MDFMRNGTIGWMKKQPIKYNGTYLGDLKTIERSDWKNRDRDPTPLDFEMATIALAAQAIYEVLDRYPNRPDGNDKDEPWLLTISKIVCDIADESKSKSFEEDVMRQYIGHYGMNQIITIYGGKPERIFDQIEQFKKDNPS